MASRFASVVCAPLSVPLHTPFVTALRRTTTTDTVIVRVTDSDGVSGWGEAPQVWQVTGESLASATACLEQMLAPVVVGRNVDDWDEVLAAVQRAVARNFGVKAAVDAAVRDLVARRVGVALAAFVGSGGSEPGAAAGTAPDGYPTFLRTDVTLSAGSAGDLATTAVLRVANGFSMLKMKVGTDAATDVARVRAVREAVGSTVTIRLDANQGWTPDEAVRVIRALEDADLGVELVEQPVRGEDVEGLAHVRAHVGLPIMADEALFGLVDLDRIIRLNAADLVNVKLAKCGSLSVALEQLRRAADAGLGTMVGSMMETAVGVGAIAAVAAAHPAASSMTSTPPGGQRSRRSSGAWPTTGTASSYPPPQVPGSRRECNPLRWLHDVVDRTRRRAMVRVQRRSPVVVRLGRHRARLRLHRLDG
ncbi:MAG: dipeptide epimerase [Lapillicoccus sp.]